MGLFLKKWKNKGKLCHSQVVKVVDYDIIFNKLVTRDNKRERSSQASYDEDDKGL